MATRLEVQKTYKLFINGQFPRTESGRFLKVIDKDGAFWANACRASRKDLRNAVESARKAQTAWNNRAAFNRSQILYRIAEMLESRRVEFEQLLIKQGTPNGKAKAALNEAIDAAVYYAGWADKYQQVFSSVNPVSGNYFNFSVYEPTGVVINIFGEDVNFSDYLNAVLSAIVGGNTIVNISSANTAPYVITLAETLATSDLSAGVVNILTGNISELISHAAKHMDVNAIVSINLTEAERLEIESAAPNNVKRIFQYNQLPEKGKTPYLILDLQEVKTTWHPIDSPIAGGNSY